MAFFTSAARRAPKLSMKVPTGLEMQMDLMNEAASHGRVYETESAFHRLQCAFPDFVARKSRFVVNTVLKACANRGELARAVLWHARMVAIGVELNVKTFGKMIEAAAKTAGAEEARDWLQVLESEMASNLISGSTVIDAYARAGRPEEASMKLDAMDAQRLPLDHIAYTSVVDAYAKMGKPMEAKRWQARMLDAGIKSDVVVHNVVLNAFAKAAQPQNAVDHLAWMIEVGTTPTSVSYRTVVDAHIRAGSVAQAMESVYEMERKNMTDSINPYNAVLMGLARQGKQEEAVKWFHRLADVGQRPDIVSYTCMVNACAQHGQVKEAVAWVDAALAAGLEPDSWLYNGVLKALVISRGEEKELAVQQWLTRMRSDGVPVAALSFTMALEACKANARMVARILEEIVESGIVADAALQAKVESVGGRLPVSAQNTWVDIIMML